jgi:hypothetical protein
VCTETGLLVACSFWCDGGEELAEDNAAWVLCLGGLEREPDALINSNLTRFSTSRQLLVPRFMAWLTGRVHDDRPMVGAASADPELLQARPNHPHAISHLLDSTTEPACTLANVLIGRRRQTGRVLLFRTSSSHPGHPRMLTSEGWLSSPATDRNGDSNAS